MFNPRKHTYSRGHGRNLDQAPTGNFDNSRLRSNSSSQQRLIDIAPYQRVERQIAGLGREAGRGEERGDRREASRGERRGSGTKRSKNRSRSCCSGAEGTLRAIRTGQTGEGNGSSEIESQD
jgi:hypothetical protein